MRLPPPLIVAACLIAGFALHTLSDPPRLVHDAWRWIGLAWAVPGLAFAAWANVVMARHKTTPLPYKVPSALVTDGPFAFSRNPMYLALCLAAAAIAVGMGATWPMVGATFLAFGVLDRFVIRGEERMLAVTFGDRYHAYRWRVRRWL